MPNAQPKASWNWLQFVKRRAFPPPGVRGAFGAVGGSQSVHMSYGKVERRSEDVQVTSLTDERVPHRVEGHIGGFHVSDRMKKVANCTLSAVSVGNRSVPSVSAANDSAGCCWPNVCAHCTRN